MQHSQLQNPYEALYKNLNFQVSQSSTKEDAKEIASQLAMLHKTFGIVTRDLIKLTQFKFKENSSTQLQDQSKNKASCMKYSKNKEEGFAHSGQKIDVQSSAFQEQKTSNLLNSHTMFMKKKKQVVQIQIMDSQEEDVGNKKILNRPQTRSQARRGGIVSYRSHNLSFQQARTKSRAKQNRKKSQMSISMEVPITENSEQNVFTFGNQSENKRSSILEQIRKQTQILMFDNQGQNQKNEESHIQNIIEKLIPDNMFQRKEIQSTIFDPLINPLSPKINKEENYTVDSSEKKSEFIEMPNRIYNLLRKKMFQELLQVNDDE